MPALSDSSAQRFIFTCLARDPAARPSAVAVRQAIDATVSS